MNRRIAATVAGGSLALGMLVGVAGAVAVWNVASPAVTSLPVHMAAMNGMQGHMAGQMGAEMGGGTMGNGMMGSGMMGSGHTGIGPMDLGSVMEFHRQHHSDWQ